MNHKALLCQIGGPSLVQTLSYYQGDLQLIRLDNIVSLCHKFRHIPCAVDIPSSQPIALLFRQEDKGVSRKLGSFSKDFETLAQLLTIKHAIQEGDDRLCFIESGGPLGPRMSVPGMLPG